MSSLNNPSTKDSCLIENIDKKIMEIESEKLEIEKKYGITESILNSFSFNGKLSIPSTLSKYPQKPKKINYDKLTNINDIKMPNGTIIKYKTPDNLIDSLKYEPNINDLADKKIFEPSFYSLNSLKSQPTNGTDYNVSDYVDNIFNEDYNNLYLK